MRAPKRWIETESGSTPLERELLMPALSVEVPVGIEDRIWAGLAAAVPLAAGATALGGAATATPGVAAGVKLPLAAIAKAFAVGAASGALLTGGLTALAPAPFANHTAAAPPATVVASRAPGKRLPASASAARVEPEVESPLAEPLPEPPARERARPAVEPQREPEPTAPPASGGAALEAPSPAAGSRLKEEAATLRRARQALRRGDLAGAGAALEVARSSFGSGALGEEREALTIELLSRSGQRDAASARAAAFLRQFPNSPHAENVRSLVR